MGFSEKQAKCLNEPLNNAHVKQRDVAGFQVSYIEGWHVIGEANRIFGFDAWDRETVWCNCVWSGERNTRKGAKPAASYVARVRITVKAGDETIVREGTGAGSGFGSDHGEAHESAIKEAETDAMKRAFMTFGNPFGLALYDKEQANVQDTSRAAAYMASAKKSLSQTKTRDSARLWWENEKDLRRKSGLTQSQVDELKAVLIEHVDRLPEQKDAA